MGRVTNRDKEVLNRLALDCDLYNLSEKESLEYIKQRLGKEIAGRTYRRYRQHVQDGSITQLWLNQYTKLGFVVQHQELVECVKQLLSETWRDLNEERNKPDPDFSKMNVLRHELREDLKLFNDLKFGTPIVAQIKKRIQDYEEKLSDTKLESPSLGSNF